MNASRVAPADRRWKGPRKRRALSDGMLRATPMPDAPHATRVGAAAKEAPSGADALYAAAVMLWRERRRDEAIKLLDEALRLKPDFADALCMGGYMLGECGKPEPAMRFYRRALELDPSLVVAHVNSGKLLFAAGRFAEALACFAAATTLAPDDPDAWCSRAGALRELGRLEESLEAAERALELRPDFPEAAINLGNALLKLDRSEEALEAYLRASVTGPCFAQAQLGQALALRSLGRFSEALAAFDAAAALGSREAVAGRGCLLLTLGDFERGLEGYEARWLKGKSLAEALGTRFRDLEGARTARRARAGSQRSRPRRYDPVLPLSADDGRGRRRCDFRLSAAAAPAPVVEGEDAIRRFAAAGGVLRRADRHQQPAARVRHAARDNSGRGPLSRGRAALRDRWLKRIGAEGFKIGIVWQGNPDPEADRARSIPLVAFAPLAEIAGVRLISLQRGFGEEQLANLPPSMRVETLGADFDAGADAFVDTAAAMTCLDLVVTCDTSIAHLAGALAVPVWVALKSDAEWRWLTGRADSPWYPTMRLFRQSRRGVWRDVFDAMARELAELSASAGRAAHDCDAHARLAN